VVTLSKRATPSQRKILRVVAGAVKNVSDAHPEYKITSYMARSIAKRAAGTLSAQWVDVLAASSMSSDRAGNETCCIIRPQPRSDTKRAGKGSLKPLGQRPLLRHLWNDLAKKVGAAKRAGQQERVEVYIEVLKKIAKIQRTNA
jgi:hypothetical protein